MSKLRYIPFYPLLVLFRQTVNYKGVSFRNIHIFLVYFIRYCLFEPFRLFELLLFERKILKHELEDDPIFIIGHWRSGTSHLQDIICQDNRNTSISIFTSILADCFYLTEVWLKKPLQYLLSLHNTQFALQRDALDLDYPGEMETALCSLCSLYSYTWGHIFPKSFGAVFNQMISEPTDHQVNMWLQDYDYMIRKVALLNRGKQIIVKSPGDTARIKWLLQKYPNARFIYIERKPSHVYYSNLYLWRVIHKQYSVQSISQQSVEKNIIDGYESLITGYYEQCHLIPEGQLVSISYEKLATQPIDELQRIYQHLRMGKVPIEVELFIANLPKRKIAVYEDHHEIEKIAQRVCQTSYS